MEGDIQVTVLKGAHIAPYFEALGVLRIEIFREYPYLYNGNLDYEREYLHNYASCSESVLVGVFHEGRLVGASTAIPLEFASLEWKKPFVDQAMPVEQVFYFCESVLKNEYRGQNIYREFFVEREKAARNYGAKIATFSSVIRSNSDPRKPQNYTALDDVWQYFGYKKHTEMTTFAEWREVGEVRESPKPLVFWMKNL